MISLLPFFFGFPFLTPLLDKTVVQQQLLSAPPYLVAATASLTIAYYSGRTGRRTAFIAPLDVCIIAGYAMLAGLEVNDHAARFTATFLVAGASFSVGVCWRCDNDRGWDFCFGCSCNVYFHPALRMLL